MPEQPRPIRRLINYMEGLRAEIPKLFYRTFEDKPFEACDFCYQTFDSTTQYAIMKFGTATELKQEICLCMECGQKLNEQYSDESKQVIKQMFGDNFLHARIEQTVEIKRDRELVLTAECAKCGTPRDEAKESVTYGFFEGAQILYYVPPYMLCDGCIVALYDQLSDQTKEIEGRFMADHLGLPPEFGWAQPVPVGDELPKGMFFG
jgi:hypothetical protein